MIEIDREHPEYRRRHHMLRMYRDLYAGGQEFRNRAADYLLRRQKEPLDVYAERLHRVFYENYIGSIIDWYTSTLFRREPSLDLAGGLASGREFLTAFADDCDCNGTKLSQFFRACFTDALITGQSHILLDFPRAADAPQNRAEEDLAGLSRAFLVRYEAEELINWSGNERGDYDWIVLRRRTERQPNASSSTIVRETHWYYYDRANYSIYRRAESPEAQAPVELVAQGAHGLARQRRVPLFDLRVNGGLWLMNKAAHLQLEHFNKSNALGWAITMGLFAMPVIYTDREWNQIVGESYFLQLGPSDKFGWTEPDGKVYQIAAANLETLKEEIYRVCYLSQASGEMNSGHAVSAVSKQLDFTITEEILRAYGAIVKDCLRRITGAISEAREDGVSVSVMGLDELDISDFGTELQQATSLLSLGIESPTLKRQIFQRLAFKYLDDARQEVKDQIAREIQAQLLR
ncbi:MAG: hypothetical protein JO270_05120 [Acidobacteriaceae bacterium]|nr:hypothetical protein [Acidobacteriaceae bacterium]MBV8573073.1 hypothetical protein [Acidobacteriaceae bacterium]